MIASIEAGPWMSLNDIERRLTMVSEIGDHITLRVAAGPGGALLNDVWAAILCGTVCRATNARVVFTDLDERKRSNVHFENSLAGLTCTSIATSIQSNEGTPLEGPALRQRIMLDNEGLVSPDSDDSQILVEFDTDYPVAIRFQQRNGARAESRSYRRRFENLVLEFRKKLDSGALRRGDDGAVKEGGAGEVGRFLAELHENGFQHGSRGTNGAASGTRFFRMCTHSASSPGELLERCKAFPQLSHYVDRTFRRHDSVGLVEASVSDFGLGIVDAFQTSPAGLGDKVDRAELLLDGLIYGRLTSKSNDKSAGLGIQKALDAARSMQAFVSLRTGEFWLTASFLPELPDARLTLLGTGSHPPVAGTHWQIFWPQP